MDSAAHGERRHRDTRARAAAASAGGWSTCEFAVFSFGGRAIHDETSKMPGARPESNAGAPKAPAGEGWQAWVRAEPGGKPGGVRGASVGVIIVAGIQWTGVVGFLKRSEPVRRIRVDIRRSVDPLTRHLA